jgi:hypothetical protein
VALTPAQAAALGRDAVARILAPAAAASSDAATDELLRQRARRGLALELGRQSALREALAAKLELLADGLPVSLRLSSAATLRAGPAGAGSQAPTGDSAACLRLAAFCCADLAARGEQLLALLWALYAHEAPRRAQHARAQAAALASLAAAAAAAPGTDATAGPGLAAAGPGGASAGRASAAAASEAAALWGSSSSVRGGSAVPSHGPSAYDKVFLEAVLLAQCGPLPGAHSGKAAQPPRRPFRPLQTLLLEAPALPDGLCAAVARRCLVDPYCSRPNVVAASQQAVKTGLNVLKVSDA